nr:MAG TPA: antitoxin [Crassvirales sp.]
MGKIKIGSMKHLTLVEGDVNLLTNNEVLVSEEEGYTLLRKRLDSGGIKTFVVIPLEDFIKKDGDTSRKKVEET